MPVMLETNNNNAPDTVVNKNNIVTMNIFADGTDSGPAPLQNTVNLVKIYEVTVDLLNVSTAVNDDATNATSQLRNLTEYLRIDINNSYDKLQEESPTAVISPNIITSNL